MHVIFKLRASVTGPEFISADDVDASPSQDDIYQRTGGDTLHKDSRLREISYGHGSTVHLVRSNTAWCGIFAPCDVTASKTPRHYIEKGSLYMTFVSLRNQMTAGNAINKTAISGTPQTEPPCNTLVHRQQ
jgi:hypothetical protein